jgi:hypothetical protein
MASGLDRRWPAAFGTASCGVPVVTGQNGRLHLTGFFAPSSGWQLMCRIGSTTLTR